MRRVLRVCAAVALIVNGIASIGLAQAPSFLFDFGPGPVEQGYIGVTCDMVYTAERGYGFAAAVDGRDRGNGPDTVRRDFCHHKTLVQFMVDIPNGLYQVDIIMGDHIATQVETNVSLEGEVVLQGAKADRASYIEQSFRTAVWDGQLNLELAGTNTVRINGLKITRLN